MPNTKRKIIALFTHPDGIVRIVVATVAFGMGHDSPNVRTVIHWGPPEDLEAYVLETGCGGCDNVLSHAILYYNRRDIAASCHASDEVRRYCENMNECCRALLMRQFTDEALDLPLHHHLYCDVCACMCNSVCVKTVTSTPTATVLHHLKLFLLLRRIFMLVHVYTCTVPETIQETWKEQLVAYQCSCQSLPTPQPLVGIELCTGLTDHTITTIASVFNSLGLIRFFHIIIAYIVS